MRELTLFDMEREVAGLVDEICELVPGDDAAKIAELEKQVEALLYQEHGKVDAIAAVLTRLEGEAIYCNLEAKRLAERAQRIKHKRERLAGYVMHVMGLSGTKRLDGAKHTLTRQQNPPHVEVHQVLELPFEFQRWDYTFRPESLTQRDLLEKMREVVPTSTCDVSADKNALKNQLVAGEPVDGAWFEEGAWRLVVR